MRRRLALTLALVAGTLGATAGPATAQGPNGESGYWVTFSARVCPSYADVFANRARNNIMESLRDLGPDTQYGEGPQFVNPASEALPPQDRCRPIPTTPSPPDEQPPPRWEFTTGRSYETRAVSGPWGSLSIVHDVFPRNPPILTRTSTPLRDTDATPIPGESLEGATSIELTNAERDQASSSGRLWAQGGTPDDPVLAQRFFIGSPGNPAYGFAALRCATDNLNGDNVEYIFFPPGVKHVFCYAYYVKPPPTAGTIVIRKRVVGEPAGEPASFPFEGDLSYDPNGFQLRDGESHEFPRAAGQTWTVREGGVEGYRLDGIDCTSEAEGGGPGTSTTTVTGSSVAIGLAAGDRVTCTFTNRFVPPTSGLQIRKVTRRGVGTFRYRVEPVDGDGPARRARATTTEENVPAVASPSPLDLEPGRYRIIERVPRRQDGRWIRAAVRCGGERRSVRRPVEVTIQAGRGLVCTFVNRFRPRGSISLAKVTVANTGTTLFSIRPLQGPAAAFLQTATTTRAGDAVEARPVSDADATDSVRLGRYRIVEQLPAPEPGGFWRFTSVRCDGVLVPFAEGAIDIRLTASAPDERCVFTNEFVRHPEPPPPTPPTPPPGPAPPDVSPVADLAVTKRASPTRVIRGGVVTYRVRVRNRGPDAAENVVLGDQLFGRAQVLSVRSSRGRCTRGRVTICRIGTLRRGRSVTVRLRVRVLTRERVLPNRAVAGASTEERSLRNNAARARVTVRAPAPPRFTG